MSEQKQLTYQYITGTKALKHYYECFEANPGLRAYFGNVRKGQPTVYETPFAKGESTESMLNAWKSELVSISDVWPSLWSFELDLAAKVGPMSVVKPLVDRYTDVEAYYEGILSPSQPINLNAISSVLDEWKGASGLRPRSEIKTVDAMRLSTNSGSPYFTKRRSVVGRTLPCSVHPNGSWVDQTLGKDGVWSAAAVLGWRGQEGGISEDDVKQRVVWMFPFAVNVCELTVYQPLIAAAQIRNLVPAWVSMESVDEQVTKMFDTKGHDDLVVCTDFTKFDQHFNESLQQAAKTLLIRLFTPTTIDEWLENVYPVKYMIPIFVSEDEVYVGKHGMASGSGGTNADETLAHRCLQYEAADLGGAKLNPYSQCLGDDGILTYPGITVEQVVAAYSRHGLEMNMDKQYASSQDCVYLRRWHHADYRVNGVCVGVYSTCRALGRLRYIERRWSEGTWTNEMIALRQLSILENVKYHPLKESFVQFVMRRDKFRLGLDIPGFLDRIEVIAKQAIDSMPNFLGYVRSQQGSPNDGYGIGGWWIVNYLKSLK